MERDPWFSEKNCTGPFPVWKGGAGGETSPPPLGCKADGGGCHRAQGKVGGMVLHRAACNRDMKGDLVSLFNPLEEETRERSGKREREREREGDRNEKEVPLPLDEQEKKWGKTAAGKKNSAVFPALTPLFPPSPSPQNPLNSPPRRPRLRSQPERGRGRRQHPAPLGGL